MVIFAFISLCTLVSIVKLSEVHVVMKPGPIALVSEKQSAYFICYATVRDDWRSTLFYLETLSSGTFITGGFRNSSNKCEGFSNSPNFWHNCYGTAGQYLSISSITAAYNNIRVKCRFQFGSGNEETDLIAWAETRIEISDRFRISSSHDVAYINGNVPLVLTCIANDFSSFITWRRNSVPIGSTSLYSCDYIYAYLGYQYSCDRFDQRHYLTIPAEKITSAEMGDKWQCESFYSNRTISNPVTLKIIDLPNLLLTPLQKCQTSTDLELNCTLNTSYAGYYETDVWVHSYGGRTIRELNGRQDGKSSILRIPLCSFQDLGDYTCVWKTDLPNFNIMKTTTRLRITGPPIISSYNITEIDTNLKLYVIFVSIPKPLQPIWFVNNKSVNYGSRHTNSTLISEVPHILHDVPVFIEGYVTELTILDKTFNDEGVYTCILENQIGTTLKDINIIIGCTDQMCYEQSSMITAGVAAGCSFATFIITVFGLLVFHWFVERRTCKRKTKMSRKKNEPNDNLGTGSLSGVFDFGISNPSTVYENMKI